MKAAFPSLAEKLESVIKGTVLVKRQKDAFKQISTQLALEAGDFVFLCDPCRHYSAQLLLERKFDGSCKALTVRSEALLDGAITVEVEDVKVAVLGDRHHTKANKVDQDEGTLRLALDVSHHLDELLSSVFGNYVPFLHNTLTDTSSKVALS